MVTVQADSAQVVMNIGKHNEYRYNNDSDDNNDQSIDGSVTMMMANSENDVSHRINANAIIGMPNHIHGIIVLTADIGRNTRFKNYLNNLRVVLNQPERLREL